MNRIMAVCVVVFVAAACAASRPEDSRQAQEEEATNSDYAVKDAARSFVALLAQEDFAAAVRRFDNVMRAGMPTKKLEEAWRSIVERCGPFQKQLGVRAAKHRRYDIALVTCEFKEATVDIKVVFDSRRRVTGLWLVPTQAHTAYTPPTYAKLNSFEKREVLIGKGGWALPGTLTIPLGEGPFPAVVLVHGSGPHDHDESIGPNKPFRDMAWGLASRKIAVLRYEKRTKAHARKIAALKGGLTVKEEVTDDALAAAALLRATEGIDPDRVFVLGHSLGGMLIPRIGMSDRKIAGFIVMAGTARPLEDVILEQMLYVTASDGVVSEQGNAQLETIRLQVAKVKDRHLSPSTPPQELPLGVPARYWLDLRGYSAPTVARKLARPMLILHGGRDYQVTEKDLLVWQEALSSRKNVQFKVYPKLNHLFIEGGGKSTPAEYAIPGHVAEAIIEDIANWIGGTYDPLDVPEGWRARDVQEEADRLHVLIVSGINRGPEERQAKDKAVIRLKNYFLRNAKVAPKHLKVLVDRESFARRGAGVSTAENLKRTIGELAASIGASDRFVFYYVGQANVVAAKLRFNLPGKDATHEELAEWLSGIKASSILIVLDSPGAGLAVKSMMGPGRIVVCGSRSDQTYSTRFSEYFIPALTDNGTDENADGRVSLLEAFTRASKELDELYQDQDLLKTETPLLEDDGDGLPSQQPWRYEEDKNDGRAASQFFFIGGHPIDTNGAGDGEADA